MKNELKFMALVPVFGALGALATAAAWQVFSLTLMSIVPAQLAPLSCLTLGLVGPLVVWGLVLSVTRALSTSVTGALRRAASVGLGLVIAAEIGFYIPLGFLAIAFH